MKCLKYFTLPLFFFLGLGYTSAQFFSESFETPTPNCPGTTAFLDNCYPDWINTNGSAGVKVSIFGSPAFDGERFARMYVDKRAGCVETDRGEGIALEYPFQAGQCYRLSYALKGKAEDVAWILTSGLSESGDKITNCNGLDIVPDIPANSFVIPQTVVQGFDSDGEWIHFQNILFTPTTSHSQLWIRASNQSASVPDLFTNIFLDALVLDVCCPRVMSNCETTTDLTACPSENDFGFIALDCQGDFSWTFPVGSTASELTTMNQSLVVNASPGFYQVTVTDDEGCSNIYQYEIEEECCDSIVTIPCVAPGKLDCISTSNGQVIGLTWAPVAGAQGYIITIVPNDDLCGCKDEGDPFSILTGTNAPPYYFNVSYNFNCYSWRVQTICADGSYSEPSVSMCVSKFGCKQVDW